MKLWLLRPVIESGLWDPWYDKAFGFVVRAKTEEQARKLAEDACGEESQNHYSADGDVVPMMQAWIDPSYSTCVELTADGDKMVIIRDFASA
jgi:hypothetical protein